ncbi:MAG: 50S ribosomal protein L18 [Candidatus Woesearchaeota archaeon]|jgi:large subunit ribosomal protein L18
MKSTTRFTVRYRRKRESKTNYRKRLELLKGKTDRLVIRKTNTQVIMQIVRYHEDGDKVLITTQSNELAKKGWKHSCKNIPATYLAGMLIAQKAKAAGLTKVIPDLGLQTPLKGSKLFAAIKGAIDNGLEMNAGEEIFPSDNRINGAHIAGYLENHKTISQDFEKLKKELAK